MKQQDTRVVLYTVQEMLHTAALRASRKGPQASSVLLTQSYRGGPASSTFLTHSLQFYVGKCPYRHQTVQPTDRLIPRLEPFNISPTAHPA